MPEIIDLSQDIFTGMPVYKGMPQVQLTIHATHEQWEGISGSEIVSPAVFKLEMGEHTGTHVDALNHMKRELRDQSIDTMPLSMFYTKAICLDLSHKKAGELITLENIKKALKTEELSVNEGDTILLYTDHFRRTYGTEDWPNNPGITTEVARWFGEKRIAAFGVESMSPGIVGKTNKEVHRICGEMGFTHYENLINLHLLIGRGRFRFIGFPLKIRGGTGSPVRAVAVFE